MFQAADKNKAGHIKLQNFVNSLRSQHMFLFKDLSILEKAYEAVKSVQINSQETLNKQEFEYLFIYLR